MSNALAAANRNGAGIGNSAILTARIAALPAHAQEKLRHFERIQLEGRVRNEATMELRKELFHNRDNVVAQIIHLEKHRNRGGQWFEEDKAKLDGFRAELAAIKDDITRLEKPEASRAPQADRRRLAILGRFAADPLDWLRDQPSGRKFRARIAVVKLREGQALLDAVAENRAAQLDFADQIRSAESSQRDLDTAIAALRREIAALAATGKPDVSALLNAKGGSVRWPVENIATVHHTSRHDLQMGNALTAWLHPESLEKKCIAELTANFDPDDAMTAEERQLRVRECEGKILDLQRIEERMISELEATGVQGLRTGGRSPLALLEIEAE
jgi:hypothetical protein